MPRYRILKRICVIGHGAQKGQKIELPTRLAGHFPSGTTLCNLYRGRRALLPKRAQRRGKMLSKAEEKWNADSAAGAASDLNPDKSGICARM